MSTGLFASQSRHKAAIVAEISALSKACLTCMLPTLAKRFPDNVAREMCIIVSLLKRRNRLQRHQARVVMNGPVPHGSCWAHTWAQHIMGRLQVSEVGRSTVRTRAMIFWKITRHMQTGRERGVPLTPPPKMHRYSLSSFHFCFIEEGCTAAHYWSAGLKKTKQTKKDLLVLFLVKLAIPNLLMTSFDVKTKGVEYWSCGL